MHTRAQVYILLVVKHSEPPKTLSEYINQFEPIKVEKGQSRKIIKYTIKNTIIIELLCMLLREKMH